MFKNFREFFDTKSKSPGNVRSSSSSKEERASSEDRSLLMTSTSDDDISKSKGNTNVETYSKTFVESLASSTSSLLSAAAATVSTVGMTRFSTGEAVVLDPMNDNIKFSMNLHAGLKLLQRFERYILNINEKNEALAQKAQVAEKKLPSILQACSSQGEFWNRFQRDISIVLPDILNIVEKTKKDIEYVCTRIEMLENVYTQQLEDLALFEMQIWKELQQKSTRCYAEEKQSELQNYEQEMKIAMIRQQQQELELEKLRIQKVIDEQKFRAQAQERADRLREQELILERERYERGRRLELEQQFRLGLQSYLVTGTTLESKQQQQQQQRQEKRKSLEEVALEAAPEENAQLEEFLGPSQIDANPYGDAEKISPKSLDDE